MTNSVRAIETRYAGCHFRSRLEARWAVFFDHLGIRWEYEPQGFVGAYDEHYLPDFVLPDIAPPVRSPRMGDEDGKYEPPLMGTFVEVKGTDEQLRHDADKIGRAIDYRETPVTHGLLILGPVPDATNPRVDMIGHSFLSWHKGVDHTVVAFSWGSVSAPPLDPLTGRAALGGRRLAKHSPHLVDLNIPAYAYGASDTIPKEARATPFLLSSRYGPSRPHPRIVAAYTAARSARFEHGQSGAA